MAFDGKQALFRFPAGEVGSGNGSFASPPHPGRPVRTFHHRGRGPGRPRSALSAKRDARTCPGELGASDASSRRASTTRAPRPGRLPTRRFTWPYVVRSLVRPKTKGSRGGGAFTRSLPCPLSFASPLPGRFSRTSLSLSRSRRALSFYRARAVSASPAAPRFARPSPRSARGVSPPANRRVRPVKSAIRPDGNARIAGRTDE